MIRYYHSDTYLIREVAGDCLLIPIGDSATDQSTLRMLNKTGAFLWSKLEHPCSLDELTAFCVEEFGGDPSVIRTDITEFLIELCDKRLVVQEDEP